MREQLGARDWLSVALWLALLAELRCWRRSAGCAFAWRCWLRQVDRAGAVAGTLEAIGAITAHRRTTPAEPPLPLVLLAALRCWLRCCWLRCCWRQLCLRRAGGVRAGMIASLAFEF